MKVRSRCFVLALVLSLMAVTLFAAHPGPATAAASWDNGCWCQKLTAGDKLQPGDSMSSPSGEYWLSMQQSDGNLVLYYVNYSTEPPMVTPQWASWTQNNRGAWAIMQPDGNLVVYDAAGQYVWASWTQNHYGAWATLQDDGNFVIYSRNGTALWSSRYGRVPNT